MSKWTSALHVVKRVFMCCIRCFEVTERMTRTQSEEETANHNHDSIDRKSSIAKIIISKDGNEEHIEYTQPISIRYMGEVHIHNESHYYTPTRTPIKTPNDISALDIERPSFDKDNLSKYVEMALKDSPRSQFYKRMQRRTIDATEGKFLQRSVVLQELQNNNLVCKM